MDRPKNAFNAQNIPAGISPIDFHAAEGAVASNFILDTAIGTAAGWAVSGVVSASVTRFAPAGSRLRTVIDILENPMLLRGKSPAQVGSVIGETPGWRVEALRQGSQAGNGWVLREYTTAGNPTGRMLRWHPGGGHHGPDPYWRVVTGGRNGNSGIIQGD